MSARPLPDRFQVAFSFAGEQRELVRAIAGAVEVRLGVGSVFLDEWYEYYLAGDDADLKLQTIYAERCALAVVCVSARYGGKPWTRAEHAAIRARIMQARTAEDPRARDGVLPIRVGDGEVPGILFNTIVPDVRARPAEQTAELIVERLGLVRADTGLGQAAGPRPGAGPVPIFRVFLASPDDVPQERAIVCEVLAALRAEAHIRDHLALAEPITWDTPDGGPADCELFIGIFWGRIGSPDPVPAGKPDGSAYVSGTEYEYCQALAGHRVRGRPEVWLFRRRDQPQYAVDDPRLADALDQWRLLEAFFAPFRGADGSYRGGIHRYQDPADFRTRLTGLLRDHLHQSIARLSAVALPPAQSAQPPADQAHPVHLASLPAGLDRTLDLPAPPVPFTGEPYPGLDAFKPEQSPVFFGRGLELDRLLGLFTDPANRFIAVVGDSGTGKSSLVAAGLLPRLRSGLIGGSPWADLRLTPGERGADPFLALALAWQAKAEATGLPRETCAPRELAVDLRQDPAQLIRRLHGLLADRPDGGECLLFLDQFEELFTLVAAELQAPFVALLSAVAATPRLRVLVTLRVDFYPTAAAFAGLGELLRRGRSFPLNPPGAAAMALMITGPARVAGLDLEDELVAATLDEERQSGGGPGALPLVAFVLRGLWERGRADGRLTLAHYTAIGGLSGAVAQRVGETLQRRTQAEQAALPRLFEHLVGVNEQEVATRRRAAIALFDADARALAAALTDARLLTASQGGDGEPTVELAHEVLLGAWPDLARWVTAAAAGLRARRDLERAAAEWDAAGRGGEGLKGGAQLQRYLAAPASSVPLVAVYLRACQRRRLGRRLGLGLTAAGVVLAFGAWLYGHLGHSQYPPGEALWAWLVNYHLAPLPEPDMVPIPAGRFQMGDVAGDGFYDDELPVHEVRVAAFAIGAHEVTFAEYDLFAAATGRERPGDEGWGRGDRPVINITWDDAIDYAAWVARRTGQGYRLPSEAEWEYAARAGTSTARWWQETVGADAEPCRFANGQDRTLEESPLLPGTVRRLKLRQEWESFDCADGFDSTAPVCSFKPNPWGLYDMLGNAWEWVADCGYDYHDGPADAIPVTEAADILSKDCNYLRLRGGAWFDRARILRVSDRDSAPREYRDRGLGLRLARTD